ncbi:DAHL domain-containing protein [Magnetovibrio sp. PR-2]|uniref:DAHL domain-containing protein n=1 Tax=Magnetovibrio sp. PR-2 TaxID=3120356 RepID=UPI002FCE660A
MTPISRPVPYMMFAATALLGLLFYVQTQQWDLNRHNRAAQNIILLKQLDTRLNEETLRASALQLSNYDSIVRIMEDMQAVGARLHNTEEGLYGLINPHIDKGLNTFQSLMLKKFDLVESIKSRMAIVRNSINYLPLEVGRITEGRTDLAAISLQRLINAMLSANLIPSADNQRALLHQVGQAESLAPNEEDAKKIKAVLLHVRANIDARQATVRYMNDFVSQPTISTLDNIFNEHLAFTVERIEFANIMRIVLLVLAVVLFAGLSITLYKLRVAHDQARMTSRQFRDAVESINEGFAFFDAKGHLSFWNSKFADLHKGLGEKLSKGITYEEFYSLCSREKVYQSFEHTDGQIDTDFSQGMSRPYTVKAANGLWFMASDSRMADGGMACVRVDITDTKRSEDELRQLSRAVEQSPASVMITDTYGHISYINPKFERVSGYSYTEAVGQKANLLSSGEKSPTEYANLWQTISNGEEWRGEFHNKRKDGTLFWEYASISPVKDEHGKITHFLAVKEDITERKQAISELMRAKEQAELASHAKTQFLANMSHELRTPLNAIIGFSEIIKEQMFGPLGNDNYIEYSANILASGHHLLDVINDILDVSRIEAGTMTIREDVVDLGHLCDESIEMVSPQVEMAKLELSKSVQDSLPLLRGDMIRIKQIIINLLSNAIKFTPQDGKVELVAAENKDGSVSLIVRDTGFGIPIDKQEKILEPFEQVSDIYNRNHEGSGLGLFLVTSFVNLHDGTLTIESEIDQGTTITVTFPATRKATLNAEELYSS